jgi:hypothetical protein
MCTSGAREPVDDDTDELGVIADPADLRAPADRLMPVDNAPVTFLGRGHIPEFVERDRWAKRFAHLEQSGPVSTHR